MCIPYHSITVPTKRKFNTGLNLMEEINYKDVSLKRPSH
jgi:hypothetical protein